MRARLLVPAALIILAIPALLLCFGATEPTPRSSDAPPPPAFSAKVSRVVDGDTLEIAREGDTLKARLFDVDCPELTETNGDFARKIAAATVGDRVVWVFPSGKRSTDGYGRMLVRVWTSKGWLSDVLLKVGAATRYVDPDKPSLGLVSDRKSAPAPTTAVTPSTKPPATKAPSVTEPTLRPKPAVPADDPIVYITRTGKKYHRAGCQYLRKSMIPVKLSEAKARGYGPCSRCGPPR